MTCLSRLPLEPVRARAPRGAALPALVAVLLPACESVPASGVLPALAPPVPSEPPRDALDDAIDAAKAEGLAIPPPPGPTVTIAPATGASVAAPPVAAAPLVLVGVVPDAAPPRAVLALPDGTELVVRPGSWIPAAHAVVLGVDAAGVDLARVAVVGQGATLQPERLVPARLPEPPAPEAPPGP
jgi:hypothetical protein